eukprot:UN23007
MPCVKRRLGPVLFVWKAKNAQQFVWLIQSQKKVTGPKTMNSDEYCSCPNSFEKDCKIGYTCNEINGHCGCPLKHELISTVSKDSKMKFTSSIPVQSGVENCKCQGNKREHFITIFMYQRRTMRLHVGC